MRDFNYYDYWEVKRYLDVMDVCDDESVLCVWRVRVSECCCSIFNEYLCL